MKFGRNILQEKTHRLTEWISNAGHNFDADHDVISRLPAARCCICSSVRWLPASPPSACESVPDP